MEQMPLQALKEAIAEHAQNGERFIDASDLYAIAAMLQYTHEDTVAALGIFKFMVLAQMTRQGVFYTECGSLCGAQHVFNFGFRYGKENWQVFTSGVPITAESCKGIREFKRGEHHVLASSL